jgi:hypothetical protein
MFVPEPLCQSYFKKPCQKDKCLIGIVLGFAFKNEPSEIVQNVYGIGRFGICGILMT